MNESIGGRPQLIDRSAILNAALEIGVDDLSMHAVARRLGVSTAALYRHVASREDLLDACMDWFCTKIELPQAQLQWQDYLLELGQAFRRALLDTPGASAYGVKIGPTTRAAFHIIESALAVLHDNDFAPADALMAYAMVIDHAFHSVQKQEQLQAMEAQQDHGGYRLLHLTPEDLADLPHLQAALDAFLPLYANPPDFSSSYTRQLECLIAGIATQFLIPPTPAIES